MKETVLILKSRIKEIIKYDFPKLKLLIVCVITVLIYILKAFRLHDLVIKYLAFLFNSGWPLSDKISTHIFAKYLSNPQLNRMLKTFLAQHIELIKPLKTTEKFFVNPEKFFPHICIVLKGYRGIEKGIILINYSYYFPLFMKLFDINEVVKKYYIVLEPSWAGYFDKDILCYMNINNPVFVQAAEPRDYHFIKSLQSNLVPITIGANWWIDYRTFKPLQNIKKDIDIIMVSAWASYKRHYAVFNVISKLKKKGIILNMVLIGYKLDFDIETIKGLAKYYDIYEQIEFHESLTQEEVNHYLNRSKLNILWSRFEGFNRSIIEGMHANIPCILRKDFNYGHMYSYINDSTGVFSDENDLEEKILYIIGNSDQYSPRKWSIENMNIEKSTNILEGVIKQYSEITNEPWTEGIVPKINSLHGNYYWNESDHQKFKEDYDILKSLIKKR